MDMLVFPWWTRSVIRCHFISMYSFLPFMFVPLQAACLDSDLPLTLSLYVIKLSCSYFICRKIILLQEPKVDVVLFEEAGPDHFTSATQSWRHLKKLVEIILLQKPTVDIILLDEAGRDHFTSETQSWRHLKKLVEIILLQKPKVDVILFDEAGRDHFTSAT